MHEKKMEYTEEPTNQLNPQAVIDITNSDKKAIITSNEKNVLIMRIDNKSFHMMTPVSTLKFPSYFEIEFIVVCANQYIVEKNDEYYSLKNLRKNESVEFIEDNLIGFHTNINILNQEVTLMKSTSEQQKSELHDLKILVKFLMNENAKKWWRDVIVYNPPDDPKFRKLSSPYDANRDEFNSIGKRHNISKLGANGQYVPNNGFSKKDEFLQINCLTSSVLVGVVIQGRGDGLENDKQHVKRFKVKACVNEDFHASTTIDIDGGKEFIGNDMDVNKKVTCFFSKPVRANYIRIIPTECEQFICFRAALLIYNPQQKAHINYIPEVENLLSEEWISSNTTSDEFNNWQEEQQFQSK